MKGLLQNPRSWVIFSVILILNADIATSESSENESKQKKNVEDGTAPEKTYSVGIQVEIAVSAHNLPRADMLGLQKSDPMCVVRTKDPASSEWVVYQSTNQLQNELNPVFDTKIQMTYKFEDPQPLLFQVYDVDDPKDLSNLDEQKLMGFAETRLGRLVSQRELTLSLRNKGFFGGEGDTDATIQLKVVESSKTTREEVFLRLWGEDLEDQEWIGKTDPFVRIRNETGRVIHTTEVKENDLNPRWKSFHVPLKSLCDDNYDMPLTFECWNSNSVESHEMIGVFDTTLRELKEGGATEFELINTEKGSNGGKLHVETEIKTVHSLMEYFEQGLKLHCTVVIDFSTSNGDPSDSSSLHHIDSSKDAFNQYEQAIHSIVSTMESYSSEIPVFGFGARLDSEEHASQGFSVTMDHEKPTCAGVKEILSAYRSCVPKIHFDDTAKLEPIVRRFKDNIQAQNNEYHVLLILSRGSISDLEETKEAIGQGSQLPMSVIVVGVGEDESKDLRTLAKESSPRDGAGVQRDLVEFVSFSDFLSKGGDLHAAGVQLAREALSKIPEHIATFKVTV